MPSVSPFEVRDRIVAKHKTDGWILADLQLKLVDRTTETVDHAEVENIYQFTASGSIWFRRNSPDCHRAGQMLDVFAEEHDQIRVIEPWTWEDIESRVRVWKSWHLNTMVAGCSHQGPSHERCPITDYRHGSKWLAKVIPDETLDEIQRLGVLLERSERL